MVVLVVVLRRGKRWVVGLISVATVSPLKRSANLLLGRFRQGALLFIVAVEDHASMALPWSQNWPFASNGVDIVQ